MRACHEPAHKRVPLIPKIGGIFILSAMSGEIHVESTSKKRPNGVLHEGIVLHAEANAFLRIHEKTIVFGQQNCLRDGLLMSDDRLCASLSGDATAIFRKVG